MPRVPGKGDDVADHLAVRSGRNRGCEPASYSIFGLVGVQPGQHVPTGSLCVGDSQGPRDAFSHRRRIGPREVREQDRHGLRVGARRVDQVPCRLHLEAGGSQLVDQWRLGAAVFRLPFEALLLSRARFATNSGSAFSFAISSAAVIFFFVTGCTAG